MPEQEELRTHADIAVVVPTYRRPQGLRHLMDALAAQTLPRHRWEVVVVDNGSGPADAERVREIVADSSLSVRLQRIDVNRGPSPARNVGWRSTNATFVAFTDDDCMPSADWLAALLSAHEAGAGIVQGPTLPDPDEWDRRGPFSHFVRVEEFTYLFELCNVSYRREVLARLDGFDENFGIRRGRAPFGEDSDLGWRALEEGATTDFADAAAVTHEVTRSHYASYLKDRRRRRRLAYFISRHPGVRAFFPRPWLFQPSHVPALVVALSMIGLAIAPDWPMLLVSALAIAMYFRDWIRYRYRPSRRREWPLVITGFLVSDIFEIAVLLAGSIQWRTLIL